MTKTTATINVPLVQGLIRKQFPQWADLSIKPIKTSGWDNRTFHLGDALLVRLPSQAQYAQQVAKEQYWLPKLKDHLPCLIPNPIAQGKPTTKYPWSWSIYQWINGETATHENITDLNDFAKHLAEFLLALHHCDTTDAPLAGPENFYRGGLLKVYDADTRDALSKIAARDQAMILTAIWEQALSSTWQQDPVWVHGDMAVGNILVKDGKLTAIIDFGQLALGDPACDLAIYWTFLAGESRKVFRDSLNLDQDTWDRARGWVLWKTLCAPIDGTDCERLIDILVNEFNCD